MVLSLRAQYKPESVETPVLPPIVALQSEQHPQDNSGAASSILGDRLTLAYRVCEASQRASYRLHSAIGLSATPINEWAFSDAALLVWAITWSANLVSLMLRQSVSEDIEMLQ